MVLIFDLYKDMASGEINTCEASEVLKAAHKVYNFLYDLKDMAFQDISGIILLNTDKTVNKKLFKGIFSTYSPDPRSFNEIEITPQDIDHFPPVSRLQNLSRKTRIQRLLSEIEIIHDKKKITGLSSCFYLPLCSSSLCELIAEMPGDDKSVYSDDQSMCSNSFTGIKEINAESYRKIHNELKTIQSELALIDLDPFDIRSQKPKDLIACFDKGFSRLLQEVRENKRKRIILQGTDQFLALKTANYILNSETPYYYDLKNGIPFIEKHTLSPVVFFNVDSLEDAVQEKKLYDEIRELGENQIVILQYNNPQYIKYFSDYCLVPLPKAEELQRNITGVFISLIVEHKVFHGQDYKLLRLIKTNSLKVLLQNCNSLLALDRVVRNLSKVNILDLTANAGFWYHVQVELEKVQSEISNAAEELIPESVVFRSDGTSWKTVGLGKMDPVPYNDFLGMKYIIVIMKCYNLYQREIDIEELKQSVIKYAEGINRIKMDVEVLSLDNLRRNIADSITKLKKKYSPLESFIDNHIHYSGGQYIFKPKGMKTKKMIRCEVYDPHWNNEYLKITK